MWRGLERVQRVDGTGHKFAAFQRPGDVAQAIRRRQLVIGIHQGGDRRSISCGVAQFYDEHIEGDIFVKSSGIHGR